MPPRYSVSGMSRTCWRNCISLLALEKLDVPQDVLEEGAGEGFSAWTGAPTTWTQMCGRKMNEWTDGVSVIESCQVLLAHLVWKIVQPHCWSHAVSIAKILLKHSWNHLYWHARLFQKRSQHANQLACQSITGFLLWLIKTKELVHWILFSERHRCVTEWSSLQIWRGTNQQTLHILLINMIVKALMESWAVTE